MDRFVAVSEAVADELARRGIDRGLIEAVPGWVPDEPGGAGTLSRAWPAAIPDGAPVVGACGRIGWRKGTDLFVTLAQRLPAEVHLVWVGAGQAHYERRIRRDLTIRGLDRRVHLVGEQPHPAPWFERFDAFALTSREDPFPLVALEAAVAGTPIVTFASGGVVELLGPAGLAAHVHPALDVEGMAGDVADLLTQPDRRAAAADTLRRRVRSHHLAEHGAPALWDAMTGPSR